MSDIEFKGDFYAQSPEEFKRIKIAALKAGYKGQELTSHPENKVTGRGQFLTLKEPVYVRKGKCGFCGSLIDILGIYSHGRKCECCGKTIYQKYEKGGLITFFFRNFSGERSFDIFSDVTLRIHSYDIDQHILRFETAIPRSAKYGKQKRKKVLEIMEKNRDAYNIIEIGKKKVYSFYYPFNGMMNELTRINTSEVRNRKGGFPSGPQNCTSVQILNGVEYSEHCFDNELPMVTSFHLYRDWKVEKTPSEIMRRAGLTSSPEYFSGRGPGDITAKHLTKIHKLIKEYKGDEAAANFVEMIKGTEDMSATSIVKRYNRLGANNWKWLPEWNEAQKERDNNIAIDTENPMQMFATIASALSNSRGIVKMMGDFGMFGSTEHSIGESIRHEFLNSIK